MNSNLNNSTGNNINKISINSTNFNSNSNKEVTNNGYRDNINLLEGFNMEDEDNDINIKPLINNETNEVIAKIQFSRNNKVEILEPNDNIKRNDTSENDNNSEVPLYFESRTLSDAELNYSITDLEGKAVYYFVRIFKYFTTGNTLVTTG